MLANDAGADLVGADDLIARVADGFTDFDVALAQRELMGKVGRLGRVLGPRGLMPNPRNNTVLEADDIPRAVKEAKSGRVEYRLDKTNYVHAAIGKVSFSDDQLLENLSALLAETGPYQLRLAGREIGFLEPLLLQISGGDGRFAHRLIPPSRCAARAGQ